jgi:hypothetical protein
LQLLLCFCDAALREINCGLRVETLAIEVSIQIDYWVFRLLLLALLLIAVYRVLDSEAHIGRLLWHK